MSAATVSELANEAMNAAEEAKAIASALASAEYNGALDEVDMQSALQGIARIAGEAVRLTGVIQDLVRHDEQGESESAEQVAPAVANHRRVRRSRKAVR